MHDNNIITKSDLKIWRYMDFAKYVSLLDKKALFFSRADELGDPFEGSWTKLNFEQMISEIRLSDMDFGRDVMKDEKYNSGTEEQVRLFLQPFQNIH